MPQRTTRPVRRLFGPPWLGATAIALFVGMLFWSKIRVGTVVPRSAYADPEAKEAAERGDSAEAARLESDADPDNTPDD